MRFKAKELPIRIKKPFIIWASCLSSFTLVISINNFLKDFLDNPLVGMLVIGIILGGVISFLFFLISSVSYFLKKSKTKKVNGAIRVIKAFLIILIFPVLIIIEVIKPLQLIRLIMKKKVKDIFSKQSLKKYAFSLLIILFLFPLWGFFYFIPIYVSANMLGFISSPIPIAGTGSMYPTFPKSDKKSNSEKFKEIVGSAAFNPYPNGLSLFGNRYFHHNLQRGDIIIFQNSATENITKKQYGEATGFIKRLIALPGDSIEIKNGLVFLNGKPLKESYTAKSHSTFAETFLPECKKIIVPPNNIFAMGDNRKGSGDSREIGFVDIKDINHILPISSQKGVWDKNWRDTSKDLDEASKIKLDKNKYLELLNKKRKEAGVKPLIYQPKLEQSAFKRGEIILKLDDFSYEATRSGYTMERAMRDVGYSNIVWNETFLQGYYEAGEAIEYYFEFPEWKKFLLEKDFQEIGISEVEGILNGCPAQIIVQHFAGYVPPNYAAETVDSWGKLINNLNNVIPSWEKVKDWPNVNKDDLSKLLGLMYRQKNNAEAIYYRMKANQWLTSDEKAMANEDRNLNEEISTLVNKLNGK